MKLRIRGNTLRLRLTRGEVDLAGQGKPIVEQTHFPGGQILRYQLDPGSARAATLTVAADGAQCLSICVPASEASQWATDETMIGLSGSEPFRCNELEILIEKDFTCVTPRAGEEELDTFPNPNVRTSSA